MFLLVRHRVAWILPAFVIVTAATAVPRARAQGPVATKRPAEYQVIAEKDVKIAMPDGVRLAADIYRPARDGKPADGRFPALLTRTPYDKTGAKGEGQYYAARGYVVVANDVRGRYASEGTWRLIADDPKDGFEVVEWIARQEWSNGKVGTFGTSYPGGTQHALAEMNPPHLTTMVPIDAVSNCGVSGMRHGGAFELRFMNWIFQTGAPNSRAALANPALRRALTESGRRIREHADSLPVRPGNSPLRVVPEYEAWLVEAMRSGPESAFWHIKGMSVVDHVRDYADVPVLHITGWYDSWARQVTMNYEGLSRAKHSPQRLVIGPWVHGSQGSNVAGEVEFTREAAIDLLGFRLRWYDRWLRGEQNRVDDDAPVLLYIMGTGDDRRSPAGRLTHGGSWRSEREWPIARTRPTPLFLHADGSLSSSAPSVEGSSTTYTFDPRHPVPTIGGNISSNQGLMQNGGYDQRPRDDTHAAGNRLPLSERRDVMVFRTVAARGRPGGDGHGRGQALGRFHRARHRFHRQADRRGPAQSRLSSRVRPEHRRLDHPGPVPRRSRPPGAAAPARAARAGDDHALSHRQCLQEGTSHPAGRVEQQLSAVRRQPEHRRPAG